MLMGNPMAEDQLIAQCQFKIGDQPVHAKFTVPRGSTRRRQLLPLMQATTDLFVAAAETQEAKEGRKVSCTEGCGACCRQLVPIAPSEAHQITALVDGLPEPRRSQARERFAAAAQRLTESGLIDELRHPERVVDERVIPLGVTYFWLSIACPFLEEESCSIHADRPLACREYLVTSAPACCAEQAPGTVRGVHLVAKVSRVLRQMERQAYGAEASWVPLILALEWVVGHPGEPPPRPGPELLREFMERLTGQTIPEPPKDTRV